MRTCSRGACTSRLPRAARYHLRRQQLLHHQHVLGRQTRTASHRAVPCLRPEPARSRAALSSRGADGTPCSPLRQSHRGPAQICRREGFPSAEAARGRAQSRPFLPQPPCAYKSNGGGEKRGGGAASPRLAAFAHATPPRQGSKARRPAAARDARRAPQRRAVPPGAAGRPLGCSGRSESFCVRVPARRGLFALQQLSHYLHWL